jgi:competence protein ComEA
LVLFRVNSWIVTPGASSIHEFTRNNTNNHPTRSVDQLIQRVYNYLVPAKLLNFDHLRMSCTQPHLAPLSQRLAIMALLAIVVSGCIKRDFTQQPNLPPPNLSSTQQTSKPPININTASAAQMEKLPGVGKALAARIVEHRETYGPFRRAEHLIIVRGFSDKRFRALQELITVE